MVIIRFADQEAKRKALGYIARRFPGKSWATGEVMVPEAALAVLASEGFQFTVEGPATYERLTSLRDLLPLRFNDGQAVPDALISETLIELENHFGAVSWETQVIRGRWRHAEESYSDDLMRVIIDVEDLLEHRQFFQGFKERLKARFRQIEIYMTTHLIDVI